MTEQELLDIQEELNTLCDRASKKYKSLDFFFEWEYSSKRYFLCCQIIGKPTLELVNKIADKMDVKTIENGALFKTTSLTKIKGILKSIL